MTDRAGGTVSRATGRVERIVEQRSGFQRLAVTVDGRPARDPVPAVCFPQLTGPVAPGHRVLLNTTAVDLGLGSGGFHFVMARLDGGPVESSPDVGAGGTGARDSSRRGRGHIMKLRYTPVQVPVLAVDEEGSPHRAVMEKADHLNGQPVVIGSVHSQLAPAVAGVKARLPEARVAYVMTDGGALPAAWSDTIHRLRATGALCGCVTSGHAFGGDLEAVNVYSALLAARAVLQADVTVVMMGPGVVGTGSPFGHTALEVAPLVDAVAALGGRPVVIPRLSGADPRERHRGVSHHTLTALGRLTFARATVVLPPLPKAFAERVRRQLREAGVDRRHHVHGLEGHPLPAGPGAPWDGFFSSMGRSYRDDPAFFDAALCAGWYAAGLVAETA